MDLLNIEGNDNSQIDIRERRNMGVWLCAPVILIGAVLLSLSYIVDIIYAGGAELGIGETSAFAKTLFGVGSVINKLISPLLSGGIALYIGGLPALSGGLISGMLTGIGVTLSFSSGNTSAITGIYGSILAGVVAGYTARFTVILLKKQSNISVFISPAVSVLLTTTVVFLLDYVAQIVNGLASVGLAATGEISRLLLVIMLSIMITADIGGPLYLAAFVYAVASIGTDDPQIMAAVTAAGCVPPLSIGLAALIFRDRFEKKERSFAVLGAFCGLCGISQVAIPFYATRLHRVILPGITGGTISALLSVLFGCTSSSVAGGFLSVTGTGTFFYFFLSVLSGVLFSTAIMGYTLNPVDEAETPEENEKEPGYKKATA